MKTQRRLTGLWLGIIALMVLVFMMVITPIHASTRAEITLKGKISYTETRLPINDILLIRFALYDSRYSSVPLWSEQLDGQSCEAIPIQNGLFTLIPGKCDEIDITITPDLWLDVSVAEQRTKTWQSFSSRISLRDVLTAQKGATLSFQRSGSPFTIKDAISSGMLRMDSGTTGSDIAETQLDGIFTLANTAPFSLSGIRYRIDNGQLIAHDRATLSIPENAPLILGGLQGLSNYIHHDSSSLLFDFSRLNQILKLNTIVPDQESGLVLSGINNQISVTKTASGYTLSLPQDVHTSATPTFGGITLSNLGGVLKAASGKVSGSAGLADLAGVKIESPANGQLLRYSITNERWENWTPSNISLTGLSASTPLSLNSSDGALSLSYSSTNLKVNGSGQLDTIQDLGTTASPTFAGLTSNGRIFLTTTGDSGSLSSSGGAMHINLTNDIGSGLGIYSNAGASAQGNMINVKVDNAAYAQAAFYMNYDGSSNAVEIVSNSTDSSSNALAVTGNNPNDSTLGIIGYETGKGTIKVSHNGTGSDANASGISIDLKGTGTHAQGLYVDSTATGGTLGNLLRLRNETVDKFVVNYQGNLTMSGNLDIGANGTNTTITKVGNTTGDEFFVGTTGAFRVQRSASNSEAFRVQINGDTQGRWLGMSDGKLKWGDGASSQDITLQRGAAGVLWLDGSVVINNSNGAFNTTIKGQTDSNLLFANATTDMIGIGTASPATKLDISLTGSGLVQNLRLANLVTAVNNSGSSLQFAAKRLTSGTTNIASISGMITDVTQTAYKGALVFSTSNNASPAERMRIDYGGNVGINTNNPQYLLQVKIDGSNEGHVTSTGAWANTSDIMFKKNIQTLFGGLDTVLALRPVTYNSLTDNDSNNGLHIGFIAQEVEGILPQVVDTDASGRKSITYGQFAPLLVSAIQQQQKTLYNTTLRLDTMAATASQIDRISAIEKDIVALKTLVNTTSANTTLDATVLGAMIAKQALTVEGEVVFKNNALFERDIIVNGKALLKNPVFSASTGGYAKIKKGASRVTVSYDQPFIHTPVITVTARSGQTGYQITNESEKGFSITYAQPAQEDNTFSWNAMLVEGVKTYESDETAPQQSPTPAPSATLSPTISVTVSPTPTIGE